MSIGFSFWEIVVFLLCGLVLVSGLARITAQRQKELLKNYLEPERLPLQRLIIRPEKMAALTPIEEPEPVSAEEMVQSWPDAK